LHELGHSLGLEHPFIEDSFGVKTHVIPADYDQFHYTLMSYYDATNSEDNGYSGYYPTTPMLLDIQAIQYLYGANTTYHSGNDTYVFNGGTQYYETIWDAGGIDTIQYDSTIGGLIDLNAGNFSKLGAPFLVNQGTQTHVDNVAIAYNVTIENAIGGSGNDSIIGNFQNNSLDGNAGNDTLIGGAGNDKLVGGAGNDTLSGGAGNDTLNGGDGDDLYGINVATDVIQADSSGIDTVVVNYASGSYSLAADLENIILGGTAALNGTGNALNNTITGNSGNNIIDGGKGADILTGGAGADTFDFNLSTDSAVGVTADRITDFSQIGFDKIDFSTIDADTTLANDQAFIFIGNDIAFSNVPGQLRFNTADNSVYGDTNGDGTAEFQVILTGVTAINNTYFVL
jgi:serralysin